MFGGDKRGVIWLPCSPLPKVGLRWPRGRGDESPPASPTKGQQDALLRHPQRAVQASALPARPRPPRPGPCAPAPSGRVGSKAHQAPLNANESRCPTPEPTFPTLFPRPPFPPRPVRRLEKLVRGHFWGSKIERGAQERARSPRARAASAARPHPGRRRLRREIRTGLPESEPGRRDHQPR